MLPTPSTAHVDYNRIYEPAEDSFLLLDTLSSQSEIAFLHHRFQPNTPAPLVVEVGTGSGVVLAFITAHAEQVFGRSDVATLGTDVNVFACVASRQTTQTASDKSRGAHVRPGELLTCLNVDLVTAVKPATVDVLIFNPPYVPSEALPPIPDAQHGLPSDTQGSRFNFDSHLLSLSTDGGSDGMEVTNRLLDDLKSVLSPRGVAYILLCAQNKPNQVIATVQSWPGRTYDGKQGIWRTEKVSSSGMKAGWERLCVIRVWREVVLK